MLTLLTLLTLPRSFDLPSHSPFCGKAMALLHPAGQDWWPERADTPVNVSCDAGWHRPVCENAPVVAYLGRARAALDPA